MLGYFDGEHLQRTADQACGSVGMTTRASTFDLDEPSLDIFDVGGPTLGQLSQLVGDRREPELARAALAS
jgi:hypothetical protein